MKTIEGFYMFGKMQYFIKTNNEKSNFILFDIDYNIVDADIDIKKLRELACNLCENMVSNKVFIRTYDK